MSEHEYTLAEACERALRRMAEPPLVTIDGEGWVRVKTDTAYIYDFQIHSPGDALRWIEHLAGKAWVTTNHLRQLAKLSADHFGARYR